jgi:hypothetical protein
MLLDRFVPIRARVSGIAAKQDVAAIAQFHRIQASPGYRAAAEYVLDALQACGLDAWIERFPADSKSQFWTEASFQEWGATSATLHLDEPAAHQCKLADWREAKLSLIQRSISFDGTAEVVLLSDGLEEQEYEGLDLAGKVVLTQGDHTTARRLAVEKHGAVGILYYGMGRVAPVREPMDLPDALQYASFWWTDEPDEVKCFGFVLSPRRGAWLADLARKAAKENKPPLRVRAHVASRLYDGSMEVVCARIPGETDEESVVVSHLCHPQPSANDNASGAAAALEAARALHGLVAEGKLPRPRRGMRFLWVPEMSGTYAYLSRHEELIPKMIAGVNLDMVGGDPAHNGSTFILERPPDASASFVSDLLARLFDQLGNDATSHAGLGALALVNTATTGFSGGSDHMIFADPTVGISMPMLIQNPDKFYHTSADTVEHIDPAMMARAATLAAGAAYLVAAAGQEEATWLGSEMTARFQVRLTQEVQNLITRSWETGHAVSIERVDRKVDYMLACHRDALGTLLRLWDGVGPVVSGLSHDAEAIGRAEKRRARTALKTARPIALESQPTADLNTWEEQAAARVPRRLYRGPVQRALGNGPRRLTPDERGAWVRLVTSRAAGGWTLPTLAEYWADGRRTMLEIVDLVELETGIRDPELIVRRFELLDRLGWIEWMPAPVD